MCVDMTQGKGKKSLYYRLKSVATTGNLVTLLLWVLWTALMVYIQVTAKDSAPFDPFAILQVLICAFQACDVS